MRISDWSSDVCSSDLLATRTYNHGWRLDPIVRSLLDTDFYKPLMLLPTIQSHRISNGNRAIFAHFRQCGKVFGLSCSLTSPIHSADFGWQFRLFQHGRSEKRRVGEEGVGT